MNGKVQIPVDQFNANLQKIRRSLNDAATLAHGWRDDEYGIQLIWSDGFSAWVGMGDEASAIIESLGQTRH